MYLERQLIEMRKTRALCTASLAAAPAGSEEIVKAARQALLEYMNDEARLQSNEDEEQKHLEAALQRESSRAYYVQFTPQGKGKRRSV